MVSALGLTVVLPSTARVPVTPEIVTESASLVSHLRVDDPPAVIERGSALKVSITGQEGCVDVVVLTWAEAVAVPASPVALRV